MRQDQIRGAIILGENPAADEQYNPFIDNLEFLDEEFSEATGIEVKTVWDKEGADVLLIHSAGDIISFPESPISFSILCNAAGISWTLS